MVGVAAKLAVGAEAPGPVTSSTKTAWDIGSDVGRALESAPSVTSSCSPMTSTARVSRKPRPVRLMPFHPGQERPGGHRRPVEAFAAVDGQQVTGRVVEVDAEDLGEPRDRERGPERVRGEVVGADGRAVRDVGEAVGRAPPRTGPLRRHRLPGLHLESIVAVPCQAERRSGSRSCSRRRRRGRRRSRRRRAPRGLRCAPDRRCRRHRSEAR